MFKKSEYIPLIIAILVMAILISFFPSEKEILPKEILPAILVSAVIIIASVLVKKAIAKTLDVEIEHKIWEWDRYRFSEGAHFKRPIPMGLVLPLLLLFISVGTVKFFAFLQFSTKALVAKAAKKYGRYRFSKVNEWDEALIGFYGLLGIIALSLIARFFNQIPLIGELSKYAMFYAISNVLPLGLLDGAKIFFGSRPLYVLTLIITILAALVVFL